MHQSPCIRQCCLDEQNICLGCGRTLDEIRRWSAATEEQRAQILADCRARAEKRMARVRGI